MARWSQTLFPDPVPETPVRVAPQARAADIQRTMQPREAPRDEGVSVTSAPPVDYNERSNASANEALSRAINEEVGQVEVNEEFQPTTGLEEESKRLKRGGFSARVNASDITGRNGTLPPPRGDGSDAMRSQVYQAFRNAGFSHAGALSLSAEVGRENSFNSNLIYGSHSDPHNRRRNIGLFSWQGDRAVALTNELAASGLLDENGQPRRNQDTLNVMANFARREMMQRQYGGGRIANYLSGDDVDPEQAAQMLGRQFIRWRYDDPRYAHHHDHRRRHYDSVARAVGEGRRTFAAAAEDI